MHPVHKHKHLIRNIFFIIISFLALVFGAVLIWASSIQLPDFSAFENRKEVNSTKLYDRTGTIVLYDLGSDVHRTAIPYADMGDNIKRATVAIEDSNFYTNVGIDRKSVV